MDQQEKKEQVIQDLVNLMKLNPMKFEIKVVKKPRGIKVIYEVTQEEMDAMINMQITKVK